MQTLAYLTLSFYPPLAAAKRQNEGKMKHLKCGIIAQMLDPAKDADQVKCALSLLPPETMPGILQLQGQRFVWSSVTHIQGAHSLYIFCKPVTCN